MSLTDDELELVELYQAIPGEAWVKVLGFFKALVGASPSVPLPDVGGSDAEATLAEEVAELLWIERGGGPGVHRVQLPGDRGPASPPAGHVVPRLR